MSVIDAAFVDQVLDRIAGTPALSHEALAQSLRAAFPGKHITVCGEDDIPPRLKPVAENAVGEIYLVTSGEHCLSLTNDADAASGIVVALRGDDD